MPQTPIDYAALAAAAEKQAAEQGRTPAAPSGLARIGAALTPSPDSTVAGLQGKWDQLRDWLLAKPDASVASLAGKPPSMLGDMASAAGKIAAMPLDLIGHAAIGAVDSVVHPINHAPENAAMIASAGASKFVAPPLVSAAEAMGLPKWLVASLAPATRITAAGGGGTTGAAVRGDEDPTAQGFMQGTLLQGGGEGLNLAGKGLEQAGRQMAYDSLKPSANLLDSMKNPATRKPYAVGGEASAALKSDIFDTPGRPGSTEYAQNLNTAKQDVLKAREASTAARQTQIGGTPFNPRVAAQMQPAGNVPQPYLDLLDKVKNLDVRDQMKQIAGLGKATDRFTGMADKTLPEAQTLLSDLGQEGEKRYAKVAGQYPGARAPLDLRGAGTTAARGLLMDEMERVNPDVVKFNQQLEQLIPRANIANDASYVGTNTGKVRVAGGNTMAPKLSLLHYLPFEDYLARPTFNVGKGVQAASPQVAPNILRLLQFLDEQQK